jgi:hypothetical protein
MISAIKWRPGFSDPDLPGLIITRAYALTALLCFRRALKERRGSDGKNGHSKAWFLYAIALILLGMNKQLDLQTLLIQIGTPTLGGLWLLEFGGLGCIAFSTLRAASRR